MKKFFGEFKQFISRGNVMDLAVAVIIGGAFGKIVTSFTNDIIMPFIGLLLGRVNIAELEWVIRPEVLGEGGAVEVAKVAMRYGSFIQTFIDFFIISMFIFIFMKVINGARKRAEKVRETLEHKLLRTKEEEEAEAAAAEEAARLAEEEAKAAEEAAAEEARLSALPSREETLLTEIRDLLKSK